MPDETLCGIGPYGGPSPRSRASTVLQMMRRKITLRAELEIESAKIAATLPTSTRTNTPSFAS